MKAGRRCSVFDQAGMGHLGELHTGAIAASAMKLDEIGDEAHPEVTTHTLRVLRMTVRTFLHGVSVYVGGRRHSSCSHDAAYQLLTDSSRDAATSFALSKNAMRACFGRLLIEQISYFLLTNF
jgi:hypothetical protein